MAHKKLEVLAIIPARGGSKSIPRKNIRPLAGHPLIAYSIAAGLAAKSITNLIVSTDDLEIAEIARFYGAETPFMRPAEFAEDMTPDLPVFLHTLRWLEEHQGERPDIIVHIRPTVPLRPASLIDEAVALLQRTPDADSVRGVSIAHHTPYKMWRTRDDGLLTPLLTDTSGEPYNMPRQALPKVYQHTGHIDVIRYETLMQQQSMSGERILPIMIDSRYCVDIDTEEDWTYAEWLVTTGRVPVVPPRKIEH